jgi:Fic family protein
MRGRTVTQVWQYDPTLYAPAQYRRACTYEAFIPDSLNRTSFSVAHDVAGAASDAEAAIAELNAVARPTLVPLARLLLRTEAIASSKVEGMQVGIPDLVRAEAKAETGRKASATALEVLANVDAMQLAMDAAADADASFSVDRIRAIHERLMANAPNSQFAGQVRSDQNWIGGNDYNPCGAEFVPPPPEHVGPLLDDLGSVIGDDTLPPIVQAALVHAQFETIHPFADGNGRTGRALIHVVLRRRGLAPTYVPPISVVLANDRDRYIDGLTRFRNDDLNGWIELFAAAATRSAELASSYLEAVEGLMAVWRRRLEEGANPRADAAAWAVIDVLPAHPVITAPVAQAATGRAKAAIHQAVGELEGAGVLEPLSEARRNRSWEAAGLLDLLERMESGQRP